MLWIRVDNIIPESEPMRTATSLGYLVSVLMMTMERAARERQEAAAYAAASGSAPEHEA